MLHRSQVHKIRLKNLSSTFSQSDVLVWRLFKSSSIALSLDHLSQIKIDKMEKTTNGHAMESSHEQLTNTRRSPTEDSLYVNVGSPGSDVTLPYSPRPDPVEERRVCVNSVTPPSTEVIESGPEGVAERIPAVDAVLDGIQRTKKMQNDVRRNICPTCSTPI